MPDKLISTLHVICLLFAIIPQLGFVIFPVNAVRTNSIICSHYRLSSISPKINFPINILLIGRFSSSFTAASL